ncbi:MAG TPA: hypothetical protein DEB70_06770 [Planctomycetaceae bacterium]|nr:hypothetical protein [Planctomycetaceae bacterium]|tara:strand:- start:1011 stop:2354 length:1344 start_codon:yes stop_codon:yes gene_type:complete
MQKSLRKIYFINRPIGAPSALRNADGAFSLLELVAALAVISALTTIATVGLNGKGGIVGQIKFANIDEAKALLNSAAADCLQKNRVNKDDKDLIDEEIISDKRIDSIGFKINKADKADKCSYFQLIPKDEDDDIRFPIGFSVIDGSLSKFANPTSTDEKSISSCERWAGVNCKQGECLKKLAEWKTKIKAEKNKCETSYTNWLSGGTQPPMFTRWNPRADEGCPAKPTSDCTETSFISDTCTTQGCNREVWGLDGKFVGFTREDYSRALEEKYGQACTEWVANKKKAKYTNSPQNLPQKLKECGEQEFWFYKGIDLGSKEEFDKRICSDNLEVAKKTSGKRTVQGCGNQTYYFCENTIKDSEREYKECSCKNEKFKKAQENKNGAFKTQETGAEGCGDFWICDKEILGDKDSYDNKCGKKEEPPPKDNVQKPWYCYKSWGKDYPGCQ